MRPRFSKTRKPTKPEVILALLAQSSLPVPGAVVLQLSGMAGPDVPRKLGSRSDPIARDVLNRAAALASQESPPDVTSTPGTSVDGRLAFTPGRQSGRGYLGQPRAAHTLARCKSVFPKSPAPSGSGVFRGVQAAHRVLLGPLLVHHVPRFSVSSSVSSNHPPLTAGVKMLPWTATGSEAVTMGRLGRALTDCPTSAPQRVTGLSTACCSSRSPPNLHRPATAYGRIPSRAAR
jgi:hypothetical protein